MNMHTLCATFAATIGATLALASTTAMAGKPPPPPPPDPCSTVPAATFPSFAFQRNTTPKNGPYTFTTYLADASGQCAKFVATWPVDHSYDMRYDSATRKVLIVSLAGGGLAGATYDVRFDVNTGPVVTVATEPVTMLDFTALSAPSDLTGWVWYGWDDFVVSPDGGQILIGGSYRDGSTPVNVQNTFWTCDLNSTAPSIDESSCKEVHRGPVNPNWGVKANWGATAATIYVTEPPPDDLSAISLYRLTLPTLSLPGSFVKVFSDGKGLRMPRTVPNGTGGELIAIFEQGPMPENCQKVIVIDPANCDENFSCEILNNQGLGNWVRTVTWLPDGRVAGVGQTAPNRQGRCVSTGTVVAFPAIDPNGTAVTTLTTGTNPEGAGGG